MIDLKRERKRSKKMKDLIFILTLLTLLFLPGCQQTNLLAPTPVESVSPVAPPTHTPTPALQQIHTQAPATPEPLAYLVDVEDTVLRIEAPGKYFSPKFANIDHIPGRASGFLIDPSGIVITSYHAIAGADELRAWIGADQNQPVKAEFIAGSECTDIAILKLEGDNYHYLAPDEGTLQAGQKIYIAGYPISNSLFLLDSGDISSTNPTGFHVLPPPLSSLEYEVVFQSGTEGGPILTPDGKFVGFHSIPSPDSDASYGIVIKEIKDDLTRYQENHNFKTMGINAQPVTSQDGRLSGMWVFSVIPDSPASKAGIAGGDLITVLGDKSLSSENIKSDYCQILSEWDFRNPLDIQVYRDSNQTVLEGQLSGQEMVVVRNLAAGIDVTPETGTVIPPNLAVQMPGEIYYQEEFEGSLTNWSVMVLQGEEEQVTAETKDGSLIITIDSIYTYAYYILDSLKVTNTRLDIKAENLGRNNNNVSLICRYSVERGWYEFNIASNGLYWIKRYDPVLSNYVDIGKGASLLINLGQATNEYGAVCKDNKLTLFINGNEIRTFTDNTLVVGQVGFSVSSFNVTPVQVALDYFIVKVP
jgi:S1-C subfamily serine protease